jgi:hypothetical protein
MACGCLCHINARHGQTNFTAASSDRVEEGNELLTQLGAAKSRKFCNGYWTDPASAPT